MANEYVLKSDGKIIRRPFDMTIQGETEINVEAELLKSLSKNIGTKVIGAFRIGKTAQTALPVGLSVYNSGDECLATIRLPVLPMTCTVKSDGELILPTFQKTGDFVKLPWQTPVDMDLVFCANLWTYDKSRNAKKAFGCQTVYLFAFHIGTNNAYQLPIPNLYTDCHVCTGMGNDNAYYAESVADCFQKALFHFEESPYNADLLNDYDGKARNLGELIRFKTTKDSFEALPSKDHWTKFCVKVGTDVLKHVVIS